MGSPVWPGLAWLNRHRHIPPRCLGLALGLLGWLGGDAGCLALTPPPPLGVLVLPWRSRKTWIHPPPPQPCLESYHNPHKNVSSRTGGGGEMTGDLRASRCYCNALNTAQVNGHTFAHVAYSPPRAGEDPGVWAPSPPLSPPSPHSPPSAGGNPGVPSDGAAPPAWDTQTVRPRHVGAGSH